MDPFAVVSEGKTSGNVDDDDVIRGASGVSNLGLTVLSSCSSGMSATDSCRGCSVCKPPPPDVVVNSSLARRILRML